MTMHLRRYLLRLSAKLAGIGLGRRRCTRRLEPEEVDRLLQALVALNAVLARASRI